MAQPSDAILTKYAFESARRAQKRPEGLAQFVPLRDASAPRIRALAEDPWADHAALDAGLNGQHGSRSQPPLRDGQRVRFLIVGAGFHGLLHAVRLLQSGAARSANDIRLVDASGGVGGVWYWNRYPGLRCDIESYCYMPLLEETGRVPSARFAGGAEIRAHAEAIAKHWNLADKVMFRTTVREATWREPDDVWDMSMVVRRGRGENRVREVRLSVRARYVFIATGSFPQPHIPKLRGLEEFKGDMFHAARWNYAVTGGSQEDPQLEGLKGKRVGVVGTAATAVQVVPHAAKFAKELFVFQRTPAFVLETNQKPTDPEEWKTEIASKPGWQVERMANHNMGMSNDPAVKLGRTNQGDTVASFSIFCLRLGTRRWPTVDSSDPEAIAEHFRRVYALGEPFSEGHRQFVDRAVAAPDVAEKLKSFHPSWCKRPTPSESYLQAFNQPNVRLVDTDAKGVVGATREGLLVEEGGGEAHGGATREYPLDVIIFCTGTGTGVVKKGEGNPALFSRIRFRGRGGRSLEDKWDARGAATLHGMQTSGFPNLFFMTPKRSQMSLAGNQIYNYTIMTEHAAWIITEALKRVGGDRDAVIETTEEAEEAWSMEVLRRAAFFLPTQGCTPGYFNAYKDTTVTPADPAEKIKLGRSVPWSEGIESFREVLGQWKREGTMRGLKVRAVGSGRRETTDRYLGVPYRGCIAKMLFPTMDLSLGREVS